jgi:hypothetical protein
MGMDNAKNAETLLLLTQDAACDHLGKAVEPDMGDACIARRAGRQCGQHNRFALAPQAQEEPTCFFMAAPASLVPGKVVEQASPHAIGKHHALEFLKRRWWLAALLRRGCLSGLKGKARPEFQ